MGISGFRQECNPGTNMCILSRGYLGKGILVPEKISKLLKITLVSPASVRGIPFFRLDVSDKLADHGCWMENEMNLDKVIKTS
jgi:hypothetical protein